MGRKPMRYQFRGTESERPDPGRVERALEEWVLVLLRSARSSDGDGDRADEMGRVDPDDPDGRDGR